MPPLEGTTAFKIPLDLNHPLLPTRALQIHLPSTLKTHTPSTILDLTPRLPWLFTQASGITNENLLSAHKACIVNPPPPVRYSIEKQDLLGTHLAILDVEGNQIAGWNHPILSFGMGEKKKKVRFPREGGEEVSLEIRHLVEREEKSKDPELSTLKGIHHHHHYHRAESFVKDGTTFLWEVEPESQFQKALFKVVHDGNGKTRKREVARYAQLSAHEREGLLLIDGQEVDELTAVLTVCAMIEAKDNFLR